MIVFVLKYTEKDMKNKYVYSLHNKNSRNASLNYIAFLFYSGDSPGIPWGFAVTINRISRDIPVWAGSMPVAVKGYNNQCLLVIHIKSQIHKDGFHKPAD